MSTQPRSGGGGRSQKKSNASNATTGGDSGTQVSTKKTDTAKPEKEKIHPKPTAEQLRIAQITNSNTSEDPQMREKVNTLIEMTQRSEEEVCCALYECDNNLERAAVFLLESLPVGAFETSSKKKKNKAANAEKDVATGDGDWHESNAYIDKREKSRNRSSNRGGGGGGGGRGNTDSRGWRGREARENERNLRDSRGERGERGERSDRGERNFRDRDNHFGGGRERRGRGGFNSKPPRSGYRGRGDRGGGYSSRQNYDEDHQEVELWDNTIAQNAEKQQNQSQDDAWGDWDNEEYVGSLKDSKVFTTSNLPSQTAASVVSSGLNPESPTELSAPPGLEHHLGTSVLGGTPTQQQGSHLNSLVGGTGSVGLIVDDQSSVSVASASTAPMMQYSAALSNSQLPTQQQQQQPTVAGTVSVGVGGNTISAGTQYNSAADTFTNAATAAATLVQQVQQQQQQAAQQQSSIKSSATLSAEQSQYFNSLSSQNTGNSIQMPSFAPNATTSVQYQQSYANVFGGTPTAANEQTQLSSGQQPQQVRRARAKLPPPSKIPSTAVEMPVDAMSQVGYLDVQFGQLDFGPDDSFDALNDKFNTSVTIESQQQQMVQSQQDMGNEYQNKSNVQQQQQSVLTAGLQNSQIADSISTGGYNTRNVSQQQTNVANISAGNSSSVSGSGNSALDQLTKNDPYSPSNSNSNSGYQNSYQSSPNVNKTANAYQQSANAQVYNSSGYVNPQSSVSNSYQQQAYTSYQQNSVNSYQQQQASAAAQNVPSVVANTNVGNNATQNIPVGANGGNNNSNANSNSGYMSSGYQSQQSAYQTSQSVYGSTGLSNNSGYSGSTSNSSTSQYSNFSNSAKLKDNSSTTSATHFESVSSNNGANGSGGSVPNSVSAASATVAAVSASTNSNNVVHSASGVVVSNTNNTSSSGGVSNNNSTSNVSANVGSNASNNNNSSSISGSVASNINNSSAVVAAGAAAAVSSATKNSAAGAGGGIVPNIQMVSQYIQTGLPYYQQPVYSYEDLQMMQQRVPHVQGYYDLNYTPTSLGAGRDNLGSVAYSAMTDGRFARTDNNSSPVSNVSSTMSQQAGSSGPMLNVPYYFYSGNVMPGGFQYGAPTIYPQQIPAANTASAGQFPKPSYNTGYGSTNYDTLSQASQDYQKGAYQSSVNQQTKSQAVTNAPQTGTGADISSSMYSKGHVALNKVNSYEKQSFHSGTPPPFNMANTQAAGGTSAQPYGMYLPMAAAGHHSMIHQPIHQDSNSTGQRQPSSSQSKSANKQGYSPSYWTGQN